MFIKRISDEMYPQAKKIKRVMDNFKTHDASDFYDVFEPEEANRLWDRFEFVFTPKHSSLLNMYQLYWKKAGYLIWDSLLKMFKLQ